jgi:hypothetical protein
MTCAQGEVWRVPMTEAPMADKALAAVVECHRSLEDHIRDPAGTDPERQGVRRLEAPGSL